MGRWYKMVGEGSVLGSIGKQRLDLKCLSCGYLWKYKGEGVFDLRVYVTSCPKCKNTVRIRPVEVCQDGRVKEV